MNSDTIEFIDFPINKYIHLEPENFKNFKISDLRVAIILFKKNGKIYFGVSDNILTIINFEKKYGSNDPNSIFLRVSNEILKGTVSSVITDIKTEQKFNPKNEEDFFCMKIRENKKNKKNEIIFCGLEGEEVRLDAFKPKKINSDESNSNIKFEELEKIRSLCDFFKENKIPRSSDSENEAFDSDDDYLI